MIFERHYNEIVVLTGTSLLGLTAGVVGCFAMLRRRSLLGDAVGHAALPGLCLGFMLSGQRSMPALLAGALLTGLLGVLVLAGIQRYTRLREDVGLGIVLSVFFGVGIVLLSLLDKRENAGQAGLKSFLFGKTAGMLFEDVVWIVGLSAVSLAVVAALRKELQLVAFDSEFARVQGWPASRLDFLLMVLIAVVVVLGLPAVGALLVAALLVIPAAAARFWTNHLGTMLVIAGVMGMLSGVGGTFLSASITKLPTGPVIILTATLLFVISLIFGPARGLLRRDTPV